MGVQRAASPLRALYFKELKRFVSCPVYLMNCGVGPLMVVLLGIGSFFLPAEQKELAGPLLLRAAPLAAAFFVGMESTTAAALSLEGRSRWILYSAPVDTRTIFNAKIAVSLTASAPAVILGGPLLTLGLGGGPAELLMMMAVPAVYAVLSAVVGLAVNLKFPNYDWTTETAVVKQGSRRAGEYARWNRDRRRAAHPGVCSGGVPRLAAAGDLVPAAARGLRGRCMPG